jgi:hypothetical protein
LAWMRDAQIGAPPRLPISPSTRSPPRRCRREPVTVRDSSAGDTTSVNLTRTLTRRVYLHSFYSQLNRAATAASSLPRLRPESRHRHPELRRRCPDSRQPIVDSPRRRLESPPPLPVAISKVTICSPPNPTLPATIGHRLRASAPHLSAHPGASSPTITTTGRL